MILQFLAALATTLFTSQALPTSVDYTSPSYLTGPSASMALQCTWTGATVGVSDIVLEVSLDNVNWVAKAGASTTIATTAGTEIFALNLTTPCPYYRVRLVADAAATGTVSCIYVLKAP